MKKTLSFILLSLMIFAIVGCTNQPISDATSGSSDTTSDLPAEQTTVRLGGLKGPTTMGLVKLLEDAENGLTENKYEYTMEAAADALTPRLLKGELDIISIPANAAAILYSKSGGKVVSLGVNTLGVISIVEKGAETITKPEDLKGKTIYATGKGTTPEYVLTYILKSAGLDIATDVEMVWKSEPSEIVALMATTESAIAMLPQPFITVASSKLKDLHISIDLTEAWDKCTGGASKLCTSVLLARREFVEEHPEAVDIFLKESAKSAEYINSNVESGATLVEKYGIVAAAVAKTAIPYCHIVSITGADMKSALEGYLNVLYECNPASVGGSLPAADFYYLK